MPCVTVVVVHLSVWTRLRLQPMSHSMIHELDARGLLCPLPVLKARKRLIPLSSGEVLRVMADDPAAWVDFPLFCQENGHVLKDVQELDDGTTLYLIEKA